jgi:hypothetical protein
MSLVQPTAEQLEDIKKEFSAQANEATISPSEVEQKMVEKELSADPSGTPADKAAAFFQMSALKLKSLIDNMSLRELKRMVMNVGTYPYLDRNYEVKKGSVEEKATYCFNEMVWQKTIMQLQFEQEKAEKALAEGKDKEAHSLKKGDNAEGEDSGTTETKNE